jgi:hypothetical protein
VTITVVEFWGSPGSGKSTFAAEAFCEAAKQGLNAHLVTEFIKDHAVRGLPIEELDQIWINGKQCRKEAGSYGKFDYIFTDSPVLLPSFFATHHDGDDLGLASVVCRWENRANAKFDIKRVRVFLPLVEEWFKSTGRYESFEQSKVMSEKMVSWMTKVTGQSPVILYDRNRETFLREFVLPKPLKV